MFDPIERAESDKREILDSIKITRSILNKGAFAPKGFIFYHTSFTVDKGKYQGHRVIDLEKEKELGQEVKVNNIKTEIYNKHFDGILR